MNTPRITTIDILYNSVITTDREKGDYSCKTLEMERSIIIIIWVMSLQRVVGVNSLYGTFEWLIDEWMDGWMDGLVD